MLAAAHADRAGILVLDDAGVMRFRAWRGLSDTYRAAVEGHSPWAVDDPEPAPMLVPDVLEDAALAPFRGIITAEGIRALAFIPLVHQGRLLGKFMLYYDAPYRFAEDEVEAAGRSSSSRTTTMPAMRSSPRSSSRATACTAPGRAPRDSPSSRESARSWCSSTSDSRT